MADWRWVYAHGQDKLINFDLLATITPRADGEGACIIWSDDSLMTIDAPTFKELQGELEKTSQSR